MPHHRLWIAPALALVTPAALAQQTPQAFAPPSTLVNPPMTIPNGNILRNDGKALAARHQLASLRSEALSQQAADGGSLTPGHRLAFQKRIDALQAVYGVTFRSVAD